MTKNIILELNELDNFFDKYNQQKVSLEVINYLLKECSLEKYDYQILVYNNIGIKNDLDILIKETLISEYQERKKIYQQTNIKQIWLLAIGIILLLVSMGISELFVFKEVILIAGWVLVWETIDIQLFSDINDRRKLKLLFKLINSNVKVIKKIDGSIG